MHLSTSLLLGSLSAAHLSLGQLTAIAKPQLSTFNSSYSLTDAQIKLGNMSPDEVTNFNTAFNYERSQLANGGPDQDDFYTLPPLAKGKVPAPGTLLKSQPVTKLTSFSLGANMALSRIMYTTTNLNGTVVPTTGFVLWPYHPKQFSNSNASSSTNLTAPVALWCHGTSGYFRSGAPSSQRQLWYEYKGPFALALAGYAVVAPDYAGLGISRSWDNTTIPHQYLASPASARDALYALQAARTAFSTQLDSRFVSIGQSQGGGVAWGVAEAVAQDPKLLAGGSQYLGSVAVSPTTDLFGGDARFIAPFVGVGLDVVFPGFNVSQWLTPQGYNRLQLGKQLEIALAGAFTLFGTRNASYIAHANYNTTWQAKAYGKLSNAGRKNFTGPLLVIQGADDVFVPYAATNATAEATGAMFPGNDLEFLVLPGVGHVPALHATQHLWLKWIEDRFEGKPTTTAAVAGAVGAAGGTAKGGSAGYRRTNYQSFRPIGDYQKEGNTWLGWAQAPEYGYLAPLAL